MTAEDVRFTDLGLRDEVLRALDAVGYEAPTPIQAATIPPMLEGRDVLGQAQTGTGKTAAFALPILSRIDLSRAEPQALILAPTRELALQVAEAIQVYAAELPGFHVLPIYGGTGFEVQLKALRRGVHVVVGTPGRVMDHMRRGTLTLDGLDTLVLDEADEMLRMGFVDDVNWVLEHAPEDRRIALFSATMPPAIRKIAGEHLRDPVEVRIDQQTRTAETIRQRYRVVPFHHKLDVLTRILESEEYDGMIIFVRTRNGAVDLADRLSARGVACAALNGDIPQKRREQIVEQLKSGRIDVLIATDVAARGLDVERITHVINFDPPHDTEAYVHRIGRTGRAGRDGEAILFVTPRERRMVQSLGRSVGQPIEAMLLPTTDEVNERRVERFKARVADALDSDEAAAYRLIVEELVAEGRDPLAVGAALMAIAHEDEPLLLDEAPRWERELLAYRDRHGRGGDPFDGGPKERRPAREPRQDGPPQRGRHSEPTEPYRIEVGRQHDVRVGNIVGAIAGETGLDGKRIGRIDIRDDYSIVELPVGMPPDIFRRLQKAWVAGQQLDIRPVGGDGGGDRRDRGDRNERPSRPPRRASRPQRAAEPGAPEGRGAVRHPRRAEEGDGPKKERAPRGERAPKERDAKERGAKDGAPSKERAPRKERAPKKARAPKKDQGARKDRSAPKKARPKGGKKSK